jgi:hypothetical protein
VEQLDLLQTKKCRRCSAVKNALLFYHGRGQCITCVGDRNKERYLKNKPDRLKRQRDYYAKTRQAQIEWQRQYRLENSSALNARRRQYRKAHIEECRAANRAWGAVNGVAYIKRRLTIDPDFAMKRLLSARIRRALCCSGAKKSIKTVDLLGCSIPELRKHLESKFATGMTWDNRREWHIDHIRPCVSFNLTDPVQQKQCFHYTNLQPLWRGDNIRKGANWDPSMWRDPLLETKS